MMNVRICRLGCFSHNIDFGKIERWRSKYFKIVGVTTKADINVDHFRDEYVYPTETISTDMGQPETGIDLLVAIVDQPLEDSFYMHRIDEKRAVVSTFPVWAFLRETDIPIENYIARCIYELIVFLYEGGGKVDDKVYLIPHHETRGCLFDMNVFIDKIVYSSDKPTICDECKSRLRKRPLPDNFVKGIERELSQIQKPLYYRIERKIKKHPIASLIIAGAFAIALHVIASFIYDWLKPTLPNSPMPQTGVTRSTAGTNQPSTINGSRR
ncbi:MAG: hypothetical protein ABSB95_14580 [Dissulfurispiraceae bacterium]|jgi:hypothetical protein